MPKAEAYYYNLMDKTEKMAYHAILNGLNAQAATIIVPRMDMRQITDLYFLLRLDHPEIFWSETFQCRFYQNADSMELKPDYLYNKKQVKAHQQAMKSRIQKLIRPALTLDEKSQQLYVHDFICQNVIYDKLKKPYSHEIIGPLAHGIGVCEGIAKTVKVLCDALGLWCIIPICDNNPEKGIKYRHTWNMFRFQGKYYHMDATYDTSLSRPQSNANKKAEISANGDKGTKKEKIFTNGDKRTKKEEISANGDKGTKKEEIPNNLSNNPHRQNKNHNSSDSGDFLIRHDYVNIDDANFFRDHEPAIWKIPECRDGKLRYYIEKKMSFTSYEEVRKRCAQAVRKKKPFLFHWRGGYLTRDVLLDLMTIFKEEAEKKGKSAILSLNWSQAVCLVRFRENHQEQIDSFTPPKTDIPEITIEQANEGESST